MREEGKLNPDSKDVVEASEVREAMRSLSTVASGRERQSWETATEILDAYRPIRWFVARVIRATFGKPLRIGNPPPYSYDVLEAFIRTAARDKLLLSRSGKAGSGDEVDTNQRVSILGPDVAAALCLIHAVCVRVCRSLPERIWKPIIDDALIRSVIGFHLGRNEPAFGCGRGMLAGFSGRSGLAVQMAAGNSDESHKTLELLAKGTLLREVGMEVYGCDPLQVSALMLAVSGCYRGAAMGIAGYSASTASFAGDPEAPLWLAAFTAIELLRMGKGDRVDETTWRLLNFSNITERAALKRDVQALLRSGHRWVWLTVPHEAPEAVAETHV